MEIKKDKYKIILIVILSIILVPLLLFLFFKQIDSNTWIGFFGAYLGAIVSAIVAGGLAFYISSVESRQQHIQLEKQLETQKKIDMKVQNEFLKKQLIIEKKSEVLSTLMDINKLLPILHTYVNSFIDLNSEVNKEEYDNYTDTIKEVFIKLNTTSAFLPDYKIEFSDLFLDFVDYERNLRSLVVSTLANENEKKQGNDLVEIDPEDMQEFIKEMRTQSKVTKKDGKLTDSRKLEKISFFVESFLVSPESIEQKYNELFDKSIKLYREIDNSLFNDIRKL